MDDEAQVDYIFKILTNNCEIESDYNYKNYMTDIHLNPERPNSSNDMYGGGGIHYLVDLAERLYLRMIGLGPSKSYFLSDKKTRQDIKNSAKKAAKEVVDKKDIIKGKEKDDEIVVGPSRIVVVKKEETNYTNKPNSNYVIKKSKKLGRGTFKQAWSIDIIKARPSYPDGWHFNMYNNEKGYNNNENAFNINILPEDKDKYVLLQVDSYKTFYNELVDELDLQGIIHGFKFGEVPLAPKPIKAFNYNEKPFLKFDGYYYILVERCDESTFSKSGLNNRNKDFYKHMAKSIVILVDKGWMTTDIKTDNACYSTEDDTISQFIDFDLKFFINFGKIPELNSDKNSDKIKEAIKLYMCLQFLCFDYRFNKKKFNKGSSIDNNFLPPYYTMGTLLDMFDECNTGYKSLLTGQTYENQQNCTLLLTEYINQINYIDHILRQKGHIQTPFRTFSHYINSMETIINFYKECLHDPNLKGKSKKSGGTKKGKSNGKKVKSKGKKGKSKEKKGKSKEKKGKSNKRNKKGISNKRNKKGISNKRNKKRIKRLKKTNRKQKIK